MSPRTESLLLCALAAVFVGGPLVFSCARDAYALRVQPPLVTPLHP